MGPELLDIQPRELVFTFELKKQSSCSVKLVNNSYQYVAFKVKTTSPKKYCVRPNTGVVQPMSICDFTVTMQSQKAAPPDMQCKDKFLIQSTVVPYGTTDEGITSSTFGKDNGKYIEENKLKVVLVSPPHFTILPANGASKQEFEVSTLKDQVLNGVRSLSSPQKVPKDGEEFEAEKDGEEFEAEKDAEELKPVKDVELKPVKNVEELQPVKDAEELIPAKDVELKPAEDVGLKPAEDVVYADQLKKAQVMDLKQAEELPPGKVVDNLKPAKDVEELKQVDGADLKSVKDLEGSILAENLVEFKFAKHVEELKPTKDTEELKVANDVEVKLAKDVAELKSKLKILESKLSEAEVTITKLREERSTSNEEKQTLQLQMAMLRRKNGVRRAQVGFPFLFVCTVGLIGVALGYLLRNRAS